MSDLRVLALVPVSHDAGKLARYSFLDEELRALAAAGVDIFVFSAAATGSSDSGRIHVRPLPSDSPEWRRRTLGFFARSFRDVPLANLQNPQQLYRGLRIECAASDLVRRERISLVHSYFGWPKGYGGQLVKAATGVPLVAGLRGSDINVLPEHDYGLRRDPSFDRSLVRLLKVADRTVYNSDFLRQRAIKLGAKPARADVILKGVRLDLFTSDRRVQARTALGLGATPLILAVAGLVPIKGIKDILTAVSMVASAGVDCRLVVCGDGPERAALEAQTASLGLSSRVVLAGKVSRDAIRDYFAAADVFVHGALIEAAGNVLVEAMSAGIPIVCTDAGGPAEYVADQQTGFVVPVASPAAMADKVLWLLAHDRDRRDFGARGRARVEAKFSYGRMTDETLGVYRDEMARAHIR